MLVASPPIMEMDVEARCGSSKFNWCIWHRRTPLAPVTASSEDGLVLEELLAVAARTRSEHDPTCRNLILCFTATVQLQEDDPIIIGR